jgi:DNA-binding NarL/FixJ family response regulator
MTTTRIGILLVDDHPIVRYGLRHMLGAEDDFIIVGEVDNLGDLEATVTRTRPDIVLLDLELGDTHGVAALQHLQEVAPDVPALIYTAYADDELIMHAAELGVGGYLLKGCLNEELVRAIHTVHNGGTVLEPTVATRLIQQMHHNSLPESRKHKDLSKRETQVLACLVEGKTNRSIAETLYISEATVKFHVHAILGKLQAGNRTEAVLAATRLGIVNLGSSAI